MDSSSTRILQKSKLAAAYLSLFIFSGVTLAWGKEFGMPNAGMESFTEALVQATDKHLRFGSDIVYTFGPFHQIYTDRISEDLGTFIVGRLLYGAACGAALVTLARISTLGFGWATAAFMAISTSIYPDAIFYALTLIFLLTSTNKTCDKFDAILYTLIYTGIILGIFTKLSFAIAGAPTILAVSIFLMRNRWRTLRQKLLTLLTCIIIPIALWLIAEQSITDLPHYLLGANTEIIRGYSSAMSANDPEAAWQIVAYLTGSAIILALIAKTAYLKTNNPSWATYITANALVIIWVSFKAGMVRHDGHAAISGLTLSTLTIITYAYLHKAQPGSKSYPIAVAPFLIGLTISSQYINPIRSNLDILALNKWMNTKKLAKLLWLKNERLELIKLRQSNPIQKVEDLSIIPAKSTTDKMPFEIRDILANGLSYSPRPIIESYAAYTDKLQRINAEHFTSSSSPTYIVLQAINFDGRMPMEMDAQSFRIIASNYKLVGHGSKGSLILKKIPAQVRNPERQWYSNKNPLKSGISNGSKNWSELPAHLLPGSSITLKIKPSPSRNLQTILFKPPPIYMEIQFANNQILSYRISENTTKHIAIYPFVSDNQSLENAFNFLQSTNKKNIPLGPKPRRIRLTDSKEMLGINSADIIIEQPLPR